ncbi:MAG: response regulator [Marinilabiliaceae bacterium]|nr:response regulator [Marinilabiliaceae bacterium]
MNRTSLLLVEDNVLNQKLIFLNLKKSGFDIDIARNGTEAVERVKEKEYSLILMDIMMPIMDGYEATRLIREIEKKSGRRSRIVGLTANTYDADKHRCLEAGMDAFLTKPFDLEIFKDTLRTIGINCFETDQ